MAQIPPDLGRLFSLNEIWVPPAFTTVSTSVEVGIAIEILI